MMRVLLLVCLSIGGGVVAALAYAASIDPNVGLEALRLPAVVPIAVFFGALAGLLISPLMVWALIRRSLWRSEERRVGKECRSRWSAYDYKRERMKQV